MPAGFKWMRVTELTLTNADVPGYYNISMRLNNHGLPGGGGGGAPSPGTFPNQPPTPPAIVQYKAGLSNLIMDNPITEGNTLVYLCGRRNATLATPGGYTIGPDGITVDPTAADKCAVFYKVAGASESTTLAIGDLNVGGAWIELPGLWTPDTHDADTGTGTTESSGPVTVSANSIALTVGIMGEGGGFDAGSGIDFSSVGPGWTDLLRQKVFDGHPFTWCAYQIATLAGSVSASATLNGAGSWPWGMQIVSFTSPSTVTNPPDPGQWIFNEVPTPATDGVQTTFSTLHAFADGSLTVTMNSVDVTDSLATYDGACGTFTFIDPPPAGAELLVSYQGR